MRDLESGQQSTSRNHIATRPSTNSFYGRTATVRDDDVDTWQPGQYLPRNEPQQPDIHSLFVQMQSAISEQIRTVQVSVDTLTGRMDQFEKDLMDTAERVRLHQTTCSSTPPSSTESDDSGKQRKRRISLDLSVSVDYTILCLFSLGSLHYSCRTKFAQSITILWNRNS